MTLVETLEGTGTLFGTITLKRRRFLHADVDLWFEWAAINVHGHAAARPSRRFATGSVQVRPQSDGRVATATHSLLAQLLDARNFERGSGTPGAGPDLGADVSIDEFAIVWMPWSVDPTGIAEAAF